MTDPYSTHLPLLLRAVAATAGDVLELGVGTGSTPALHQAVCLDGGRRLVSMDSARSYLEQVEKEFSHPLHEFYLVPEWNDSNFDLQKWSVVLIDHRPARRRRHDALRLANLAEYVICHDTEPGIDRFYRYSTIFPKFKFVLHSEDVPRTTVLSNLRDSL